MESCTEQEIELDGLNGPFQLRDVMATIDYISAWVKEKWKCSVALLVLSPKTTIRRYCVWLTAIQMLLGHEQHFEFSKAFQSMRKTSGAFKTCS